MAIRTRDYINAKNVAKLQVAGAILKRLRCLDGRDERDRLAALRLLEGLLDRFEDRCSIGPPK